MFLIPQKVLSEKRGNWTHPDGQAASFARELGVGAARSTGEGMLREAISTDGNRQFCWMVVGREIFHTWPEILLFKLMHETESNSLRMFEMFKDVKGSPLFCSSNALKAITDGPQTLYCCLAVHFNENPGQQLMMLMA